MSDQSIRGRFLWHELVTADLKAAGRFFTTIADWKTEGWDQKPDYQMFVAKTGPMAGLAVLDAQSRAAGARPHWLTYIGSPDAAETGRQAVALGGRILKPLTEMPPVGKWVVLQDPQGAVFAAFTPSQAPTAPEHPVELGDFSWHELATSDGKAAFEFYKKLFGWQETSAMDMGPDLGVYQMYGRGGAPLGGIYNKPKKAPGPSAWLPYIRVTDARTTPAATTKGGGQVINGPLEVPGGDWITMALDPQGSPFATHSVKPVEQATVVKTAKTVKTAKKAKVVKKAKGAGKAKRGKQGKRGEQGKRGKQGKQAKRGKQGKPAKGAKKAARAAKKTRRATKRRR